jgi:hypothetical protein
MRMPIYSGKKMPKSEFMLMRLMAIPHANDPQWLRYVTQKKCVSTQTITQTFVTQKLKIL